MPNEWINSYHQTNETEILDNDGVKIHDYISCEQGAGVEVDKNTHPELWEKLGGASGDPHYASLIMGIGRGKVLNGATLDGYYGRILNQKGAVTDDIFKNSGSGELSVGTFNDGNNIGFRLLSGGGLNVGTMEWLIGVPEGSQAWDCYVAGEWNLLAGANRIRLSAFGLELTGFIDSSPVPFPAGTSGFVHISLTATSTLRELALHIGGKYIKTLEVDASSDKGPLAFNISDFQGANKSYDRTLKYIRIYTPSTTLYSEGVDFTPYQLEDLPQEAFTPNIPSMPRVVGSPAPWKVIADPS